MNKVHNSNYIGYVTLMLTFFIWGGLYIVSKYALAVMPPFTVLLCRYIGAVLLLGIMTHKSGWKKVRREDLKYLIQIGVLGYFASVGCQMISIQNMNGSISSLLNSTMPVFISSMAVVVLKEKITWGKVAAILLSVAGAFAVIGMSGSVSAIGLFAAIGCILLWSYASVLIRKISGGYSSIQVAFCGMFLALIFAIPSAFIELRFRPCVITKEAVLALLYMAIMATGVAHTLWSFSLSKLPASTCSMFYPMQPLVSVILGALILGEKVTVGIVIGGIMISAGIVLGVLSQRKASIETASK